MTSRRVVLQGLALGAAAWAANSTVAIASKAHAYSDIENGTALKPFGYGDVVLAPGPWGQQLEHAHEILMEMNEDSLLRPFRMAAGMLAPGNDMAGWYAAPRFLAETFGQWISALSRYHAATPHEPTRLKIERLMLGFDETMASTENLLRANGNPLYLHDKLVQGIEDTALVLGKEYAADMLSRFADATQSIFTDKHSSKKWPTPDVMTEDPESLSVYNFAETYLIAWQRSNDPRYLELAKEDLQDGFCAPLSRGENVLAGRHAYGHINTLCGAAKAYLVLGDKAHLRAAVNGLAFAEAQSFSTGGYGPGEGFLPKKERHYSSRETGDLVFPAIDTIGDSVLKERYHFETGCGSYAHFKLTRYLVRITKDARYGDSMERILYNAALGALPLSKFGKAFYQSNYARRARKEYFNGYDNLIEDEWPCCSGTLPQLAVDYKISTYFHDSEGIYVNLYLPSTVRWSGRNCTVSLIQAGHYPLSNDTKFTIQVSKPSVFELRFRIPSWAEGASLSVNGSSVMRAIESGTFTSLRRMWRTGDIVELTLPMRLQLHSADEKHPDLVALRCGPMVLFAIGDDLPRLSRETLLAAKQVSPGSPEWRSGEVRFLPWWIVRDETYTTYHDVS